MPRARTPTAIKIMDGNPGKRALNKRELKPGEAPSRPTTMTKVAKRVWDKLVSAMPPGVYTSADTHLLAAYCEAVAAHQLATSMISTGEHEIEGSMGQTKVSPWFRQQSDAARLIVTIGARLGLDPVSRSQIATPEEQQAADGLSDLIN